MALYNEIQVGRINRFIQKLLAIKGGPPVPTVSSDLGFSIDLLNGVETRYLEGWDRFGVAINYTTAASQGAVRLRNPVGSNVIAVVERSTVSTSVAGAVFMQYGAIAADYGTVATPVVFDSRGRTNPTCVASSVATGYVSLGATPWWGHALAINAPWEPIGDQHQEVAILPGYALQVANAAGASAVFYSSLMWRERYLEDSERS